MASRPRYLLNRNGRYFARLVVPADLRPFLDGADQGKTELREALGPDYRTALKRHHAAVTGIQCKIAQAERRKHEAEATPLPTAPRYEMGDAEIARHVYEWRLEVDESLRNSGDTRFIGGERNVEWLKMLRRGASGALDNYDLHDLVGYTVDRFREAGNTSAEFDTPAWRKLARMVCQAMLESLNRVEERDSGHFHGLPQSAWLLPREESEPHKPVSLRDLFRDYLKARAQIGKGREAGKRWAPVIEDLIRFIGHDDVTRYTKLKIREWRDAKLETLKPKTVSQVYLASIRTILKWAKENELIVENVAEDVRQPIPKRVSTRERGYTDEEARAVLAAARAYKAVAKDGYPVREAPTMTAAKRWLPWLAAFSGARIAEIAQVRREDIRQEQGTWIVRITPDAGTVKTGQYRDVPLHAQIIELGFEDYLKSRAGPLFYEPGKGRDPIKASRTVADRVAKWLKDRALVPEGVSPHHGWRHRFKTVGMDNGVSDTSAR